jgi:hypothetical protein
MPAYHNASGADLTLGNGVTIAKGATGEADPQSTVELAWVEMGWLVKEPDPAPPETVAEKPKK